jgi:hypothetical protein
MRETALPRTGRCRDIMRVELSGEGAAYVIDPLGRSRAFAATNLSRSEERVAPVGPIATDLTVFFHVNCNS